MRRTGLPFAAGYMPVWMGAMACYLLASLVAWRREGGPPGLRHLATRFRLKGFGRRDWVWLAALLGSFLAVSVAISALGPALASQALLAPPGEFPPELDPTKPGGIVLGVFMGVALRGKWWFAFAYLIGWALNIVGEESWFRGYLLPRQEAAYGDRAWAVHSLFWALNHLWQGWPLVILIPYAFLWSYIAQRAKNTTIFIVAHGLPNLLPLVFIAAGVLG
jgi:membrane protease YdiL (CAAX protease family)